MRKRISKMTGVAMAALLALAVGLLSMPAQAQATGDLKGQVLDFDGKPDPNVTVTITSKDTGKVYTVKTDAEGKYSQTGLVPGTYSVEFTGEPPAHYEIERVQLGTNNQPLNINFKDLAAKAGFDVNAAKKKNEQFKNMKTHFNNGIKAMHEASAVKGQIQSAAPAQKATLEAQLNTDYQTAASELQQAKESAPPNDKNLPTILGNLGLAYDGAGKYDQAVSTLQEAVTLKPDAGLYMQLGTDLAHEGKIPEANAACEKAATLNPADTSSGAACYKNVGIVLTNAGKTSDAAAPLKKATQLNPKDALAWFLLGNALTSQIDTKKEHGKDVYIIPDGTADAYRNYLKLEPNGPHAAEAKASLQSIEQLAGYSRQSQ